MARHLPENGLTMVLAVSSAAVAPAGGAPHPLSRVAGWPVMLRAFVVTNEVVDVRAAYYERTGPAGEVLRIDQAPVPEPGPGELRVRVAFSGVNPSDVKTRAGARGGQLPFPRIVPHSDGSGTVDAVGEGVDSCRVGERVWLWNAAWGRPHGTAAEYVVLPERQAVALPDGVSLETGACLGIPALTAYHAVHCHGGVDSQHVLVAGGAGAVGHAAIQVARAAGAAKLIATVSSAEKASIAAAAGADTTIDYRTEDVPARIGALTNGAGVDRVIEVALAGNIGTDLNAVRRDGLVVAYGSDAPDVTIPFFPAILGNLQLQFFIVYNLDEASRCQAIEGVNRLLAHGALRPRIAETLPLERIAEAHDRIESGTIIGNVLVRVAA